MHLPLRAALVGAAALTLVHSAAVQSAAATSVVRWNDSAGSATAREAVAVCTEAGRMASAEAAERKLDRALELAERALAENERDAKAHFAVFCSLGRRAELEGGELEGLTSLGRIRASLDRALELEPAFIDALVAKGRMLARLPWMLGGDADEGERLIRKALELDPGSAVARLHLAYVLREQGEDAQARDLARDAMARAERPAEHHVRAEARMLVAQLDS